MIEIHEWRCEVCGKHFKDETECRDHEWEHHLDEIKNDITVYNFEGTPIKLTTFIMDKIFYVSWSSNAAIIKFIELYEEECGYRYKVFPLNIKDKEYGRIFYDTNNDCWCSVEDKIKELDELLAIFSQSL